jgi:4-hydroxythreonine-4-phosphate dehydrogenase
MTEQKSESEVLRVGITTGDINGVGPELIIKALEDKRMLDNMCPIIYGNTHLFKWLRKNLASDEFQYNGIKEAGDARKKQINVISVVEGEIMPDFGNPTKKAGEFAWKSLKAAVEDLASNKIDVLITSPINKDTIQSADFAFPGHTEYLASMSNVDEHLMLLVAENLRVGVVTGHVPLKQVSENLTSDKIISKLRVMQESLVKDFGISRPRIAVLGLNPHAGDNGLLGSEETDIIIPAIREAKEADMLVFGPFGADGFFGSHSLNAFDGVLAMYHDQGLAPFKALAFDSGVNYTAGLPIVRTSPDHGTGYDLAGKGTASANSLRQAIFLAIDIYNHRKAYREYSANPLPISTTSEK